MSCCTKAPLITAPNDPLVKTVFLITVTLTLTHLRTSVSSEGKNISTQGHNNVFIKLENKCAAWSLCDPHISEQTA